MITIEMIDEFRRRTNSGYDDAKYYLEKYNGNMLEAIIAFERSSSHNRGHHHKHYSGYRQRTHGDFGQIALRILQRLLDIRIIIADKNGRTMNIPILFPLVLFPLWHIVILIYICMMIMGFRFSIQEMQDENYNLDSIISRIRDRAQARSRRP